MTPDAIARLACDYARAERAVDEARAACVAAEALEAAESAAWPLHDDAALADATRAADEAAAAWRSARRARDAAHAALLAGCP